MKTEQRRAPILLPDATKKALCAFEHFGNVVVGIALVLFASACSSPVGPSGYNPNKPIDSNNRPPGPGDNARASATYGVYAGDCSGDPDSCTGEVAPTDDPFLQLPGKDRTYVLPDNTTRHSAKLCVTYPEWQGKPGVRGRKVHLRIWLGILGEKSLGPLDEGDPPPPPVCIAVAFKMATDRGNMNEASGEVGFNEDSWDLFTATIWKANLGFRVKQAPCPTCNPDLVARDDSYTVAQGGVLEVPAPGVLGNDSYPAGQTPTVNFSGTFGRFTNTGGGGFILDLRGNPGSGQTSFPYYFKTPIGESNSAEVRLNIVR